MMVDIPRQKLCELVSKYPDCTCDPKRFEALFKDLCPGEYKKEMFALSNALREKAIIELKSSPGNYKIVASRLVKRLTDDYGITTELATWTINTWAIGLKIIQESQSFHTQDTENRNGRDGPTDVGRPSRGIDQKAAKEEFQNHPTACQPAPGVTPTTIRAAELYGEGLQLLQAKKYDQAVDKLQEVILLRPDDQSYLQSYNYALECQRKNKTRSGLFSRIFVSVRKD